MKPLRKYHLLFFLFLNAVVFSQSPPEGFLYVYPKNASAKPINSSESSSELLSELPTN